MYLPPKGFLWYADPGRSVCRMPTPRRSVFWLSKLLSICSDSNIVSVIFSLRLSLIYM